MKHVFYYLTLTPGSAAQGEVLLNGFPLMRDPVPARATWMDMVNLHLTVPENRLQLRLRLAASGTSVVLRLRRFEEEMIVTPEDGDPIELIGAIQDADGSVTLPATPDGLLTLDVRFRAPEFDFSEVYRAAPPVSQSAAVAFAQGLAEAFAGGDLQPLMDASHDRILDLAIAYGRPVGEIEAAVRAEYSDMAAVGLAPPKAARALAFADGRLVEPVAAGDAPLLVTLGAPEEGAEARLYIGLRRGRLQVSR